MRACVASAASGVRGDLKPDAFSSWGVSSGTVQLGAGAPDLTPTGRMYFTTCDVVGHIPDHCTFWSGKSVVRVLCAGVLVPYMV